MIDYLEIGPTPVGENCQQVGTPNYDHDKALNECRVFIGLIRRALGPEPDGARLGVKMFPHDFGSYACVVCNYDDSKPESVDYAFKCEAEAPGFWDKQALIDLAN